MGGSEGGRWEWMVGWGRGDDDGFDWGMIGEDWRDGMRRMGVMMEDWMRGMGRRGEDDERWGWNGMGDVMMMGGFGLGGDEDGLGSKIGRERQI
ncbi:hypothetical protein Tco_0031176 [Tanacetum coccineum]